jgi:hypothetical protein
MSGLTLEHGVISEWLREDANCWIAIASAFLQRYDRSTAEAKISEALKYQLRDGPPTSVTLGARLHQSGIRGINYDALAHELARIADQSRNPRSKAA